VQVGAVLGEAWGLYKRFFGRFFLTAFFVFLVLDAIVGLADAAAGGGWVSRVVWTLVSVVIGIAGSFLVQAALVETVRDVRDGRADRTIGETYRVVQARLGSVIGAGILAGIAIAIGFVLLIVPGLYLLTIWSMLIPVIVIEGRSTGEAFGRSQEIVRGHGWSVLGLVIVTFLISAVASGIVTAVFSPLPAFLQSWLGSLVGDSLTAPFVAAALTTAYFRLTSAEVAPAEPAPATQA
jgi:hypothetical protein